MEGTDRSFKAVQKQVSISPPLKTIEKRDTSVRISFKKDCKTLREEERVEISLVDVNGDQLDLAESDPMPDQNSCTQRSLSDSLSPQKVTKKSSISKKGQLSRLLSMRTSKSGDSSNHFQKRREKSTIILVLIVVIFIACHSYRLALRVYEFANPKSNTMEHYQHCSNQGRYHVPVVFYVLVNIHHLFLVLNSSTNFIIYCCVGVDFRKKVVKLFCQ